MAIGKQGHRFGVNQSSLGQKFTMPGELKGVLDEDLFDTTAGWNDDQVDGTVTTDTGTFTKTIDKTTTGFNATGFTRTTAVRSKRGAIYAIDFMVDVLPTANVDAIVDATITLLPISTGAGFHSNEGAGLVIGGKLEDGTVGGMTGAIYAQTQSRVNIEAGKYYTCLMEMLIDGRIQTSILGGEYTTPEFVSISEDAVDGPFHDIDLRLSCFAHRIGTYNFRNYRVYDPDVGQWLGHKFNVGAIKSLGHKFAITNSFAGTLDIDEFDIDSGWTNVGLGNSVSGGKLTITNITGKFGSGRYRTASILGRPKISFKTNINVNPQSIQAVQLQKEATIDIQKGFGAYIADFGNTGKIPVQRLQGSAQISTDQFGLSVSIDSPNKRMVIANDGDNSHTPYVEIFEFSETNDRWIFLQKIISPGSAGGFFGRDAYLEGDVLCVAAPRENAGGTDRGRIYFYRRNLGSGLYEFKHNLDSTPEENSQSLGFENDIYRYDNNTVRFITRCSEHDNGVSNSGAAFVFKTLDGGDTWIQEARLLPPSPEVSAAFGVAVAIHGNYICVGQYNSNEGGSDRGRIHIFQLSGTTWTEKLSFESPTPQNGSRFGLPVRFNHLVGHTELLVTEAFSGVASAPGRAHIYVTTDDWTTEPVPQTLQPANGNNGDSFGVYPSIYGDYAHLAGYLEDGPDNAHTNMGIGSIWKRNSGGTWEEQRQVRSGKPHANALFAFKNDIFKHPTRNLVQYALGSYNENSELGPSVSITGAGAVYIYEEPTADLRITTTECADFAQVDSFMNNSAVAEQFMSHSRLDNDQMTCSATGTTLRGGVWPFIRNEKYGKWIQEAELIPPSTVTGDNYGQNAPMQDDMIVTGARLDDNNGSNSGRCFAWRRRKFGKWDLVQEFVGLDTAAGDFLGRYLDLRDEYFTAEAFGEPASNRGSVYIFKTPDGGETWAQFQKITNPAPANNDVFGATNRLSKDKLTLAIGAYGVDVFVGGGGVLYIYRRPDTDSQFTLAERIHTTDSQSSDGFGVDQTLGWNGGKYLVCGAYLEDSYASNGGKSYLFKQLPVHYNSEYSFGDEIFLQIQELEPTFTLNTTAQYSRGQNISNAEDMIVISAVGQIVQPHVDVQKITGYRCTSIGNITVPNADSGDSGLYEPQIFPSNDGIIISPYNADGPENILTNAGLASVHKGAATAPGTIERSIQPGVDYELIFDIDSDDVVRLYVKGGIYTTKTFIAQSHLDLFGSIIGRDLRLSYNVADSGVE